MKKIINGKMYNTETAKKCGYSSNGLFDRDLYFCEETLYRKKGGEFFLHGAGGPGSRYGRAYSLGGLIGGETIIPLTETDARKWAEENLDADEYIEIFGEVEE